MATTILLIPHMPLCNVTLHLLPSRGRIYFPPLDSRLALGISVTSRIQQEIVMCEFQG